MTMDESQLAWNLLVELRKELVESQKIRAQVIGFKITFVSVAVSVIAANMEKVPAFLFIIPAFASVFFDLLIVSYSFSIKRSGYYVRTYIEPILARTCRWPEGVPLWEQFMRTRRARQNLSFWGNMGITILASAVGIGGLFMPSFLILSAWWRTGVLLLLGVFLAVDVWSFYRPREFVGRGEPL